MRRATLPQSDRRSIQPLASANSAVAGQLRPYQSGGVSHRSRHDDIETMAHLKGLVEVLKKRGEREFNLPTLQREKPFRANFFICVGRLFVWLWGLSFIAGDLLSSKLQEKAFSFLRFLFRWLLWFEPDFGPSRQSQLDAEADRAHRLYLRIQQLGGTFVKVGQQLSIRNDLLPDVYCSELANLQDEVDAFPYAEAKKIIECTTDQPLEEIFSDFNCDPIGKGSVACVYEASLKENGQKVAVKVRRPNIGRTFAADFTVLRWMLRFLNFIDLAPRILTNEFLSELENTLMEELNFDLEARHQELFREYARKSRWRFVTAPRVYFEFSGKEVIVQEFVSGISIKDLLAIVKNGNGTADEARADIGRLRINPKIVARRLLKVNYWGLWENFFFHADPHPSNIMVQPDNRLVFIDFGSTGLLGRERRLALQEVYDHTDKQDVEGAARLALTLMEPLPPVDVHRIQKAIQIQFREAIVAMESEGSRWSERTTARLWLGFFTVTREFNVPLNPAVLRLIRGTMLYDTVAAHLDNDIDIQEEYRRYKKTAGAAARRRLKREVLKRKKGPIEEDYLRLEQVIDEGNRLVFRTVRAINSIPFRFDTLGKALRVVQLGSELMWRLASIWGVLFFFAFLQLGPGLLLSNEPLHWVTLAGLRELAIQALGAVINQPWYFIIGSVLTLLLFLRTSPRITDYLGKRSENNDD